MDTSLDPVSGLSDTSANALENVNRLHSLKDPNSVLKYYDKWIKDGLYEKQLKEGYRGPAYCADTIKTHFKDNTSISILDVGAGSGFVGEELQERGFSIIDAVEPSEGMVEKALSKNVYRDIFKIFFNDKVDIIESSKYDATVTSGAFSEGHIPVSALAEYIRITKPGGLVVIIGGKGHVSKSDSMTEEIKRLEDEGKWKCIQMTDVPGYYYERIGRLIECHVTK